MNIKRFGYRYTTWCKLELTQQFWGPFSRQTGGQGSIIWKVKSSSPYLHFKSIIMHTSLCLNGTLWPVHIKQTSKKVAITGLNTSYSRMIQKPLHTSKLENSISSLRHLTISNFHGRWSYLKTVMSFCIDYRTLAWIQPWLLSCSWHEFRFWLQIFSV